MVCVQTHGEITLTSCWYFFSEVFSSIQSEGQQALNMIFTTITSEVLAAICGKMEQSLLSRSEYEQAGLDSSVFAHHCMGWENRFNMLFFWLTSLSSLTTEASVNMTTIQSKRHSLGYVLKITMNAAKRMIARKYRFIFAELAILLLLWKWQCSHQLLHFFPPSFLEGTAASSHCFCGLNAVWCFYCHEDELLVHI